MSSINFGIGCSYGDVEMRLGTLRGGLVSQHGSRVLRFRPDALEWFSFESIAWAKKKLKKIAKSSYLTSSPLTQA
jgi:hypothetical protein